MSLVPEITDPSTPIIIATFYKFVEIEDCEHLRQSLLELCQSLGVKGTILLASEGINSTVVGEREAIVSLLQTLLDDPRFIGLQAKFSFAPEPPFHRLKLKIREEIVTMGVEGIAPAQRTGTHVDAEQWNELLQDPDVITIDTRNQYEYDIGTFKSAISPNTDNFREFPEFVRDRLDPNQNKKVAMFCTGGIRCEKASAYLLEQGFEEVYQLDGGILKYLEDQAPEESMWEGECFVFDGRVAVTESLEPGTHVLCYGCRRPLSPEDCQSEHYQPGVCCAYCYDSLSETQRASFTERSRQSRLARQRNSKHVGAIMPRQTQQAVKAEQDQ